MQLNCGNLTPTRLLTLVAVVLLAGVCSAAGAAEEPTLAPENPAFTNYLQAPDLYQLDSVGPFTPGLVPEPFLLPDSGVSSLLYVPIYGAPTTYDLRTTGKLTPIRNQGSCGDCWAFGAMGSAESYLMPGESLDFSENNLKNLAGFDLGPCAGGNRTMSVAYLARWGGPVAESADPYNPGGTSSPTGLTPIKHVQDVIYLPTRSSALDNDAIKQAVMTYGAVYTTYYHSDAYYNSSTYSYYCSGSIQANHAVCIVGWDDNYSRNNFASAPAGDGAFIIRNSWGSYWGQAGYFYMSYYDNTLGKSENAVFMAEPTTDYSDIYQYDTLGWISNSGYGSSTAWFANVFTARANTSIAAASWYTAAPNSTYELDVYTNPSSSPTSGTLVSSKTGTIATAGYHTIPLDVQAPVTSGQKFSVVVKAYVPGYSYPIPLERPVSGYASQATASAGQSYMSSNGTTWSDVTSSYANTNVCLKAFAAGTSTPPPPTTDGVLSVSPSTGLSASGNAGGPFSPSNQSYTLTNTGGSSINWTAGNGQSWVSLSAASGTLAAGASTTVTVSINSAANALAAGSYSDTVSFTNSTNGNGNTARTVSLAVNSAPTQGALSVSPSTGLSSTGNAGGPFSPTSQSYTLTNTGGSSISWTASKAQSWVSLSATSGTLSAGASTTVTVSINTGANTLAAGTYSDAVSFVNTTNGSGNTSRPVSLTVKAAATPATLEVTPSDGFTASGPVRGPFSPTSKTYTIKNTGSTTLSYSVTRTQSWLTVSSSSGTLYAGASKTITVSLSYYASYYAAGTYNDTVTFKNVTNGIGTTTRPATLQIGSTTPTAGSLSVSPSTGLSSSGNVGGPFSPTSQSYTLTNTGGSSISWTAGNGQSWVSLSATSGTLSAGASTTVTVSINSAASTLAAGTYSDAVSFVNSTNGSGNTSRTVSLTVNGGSTPPPPSPSGSYTAVSAPYNWIDPSAHTKLSLITNSVSAAQALPFSFNFYGKSYSTLYVGSNGLMGFNNAGMYVYNNTPIPYRYTPNNAIYPYWDSLNTSYGGGVYIGVEGSAPYRKVVVSWVGQPQRSSSTTVLTFQAVLEETTNDIYFQYKSVAASSYYGGGRSASIGVEDEYGTSGLQYCYNTYKVNDGTAVRITMNP